MTQDNELICGCTQTKIPESTTCIGKYAFMGRCELTSITIPESVTKISEYAFYGCTGMTSVTIPNSVTSIGEWAFYDCSSLTSIIIPNSITCIDDVTFAECSGLTSVTIPNSVISIGSQAFSDCTSLTSITIPDDVTSIGWNAFYGCSNLTSINIPYGVTNIDDKTFYGCSSLTSISIPNSVNRIGKAAFQGCSSLTSINIPNYVTSIGDYAFSGCSGFTSITIPNSIYRIGINAFEDCTGVITLIIDNDQFVNYKFVNIFNMTIKEVILEKHVTCIGEAAFFGCNLSSITIPNSVTSIGNYAFLECRDLTSITIPSSVTSIGESAFNNCNNLEYVKCLSETPPFAHDNTFSNYNIPLYVPEKAIETYKAKEPWSSFKEILPPPYELTFVIDGNVFTKISIPQGTELASLMGELKEGYTFVCDGDVPETMPDHDITITGTFKVNQYKVTFIADGKIVTENTQDYGSEIKAPEAPTKEGYSFAGWGAVDAVLPAHDVTYTAEYTLNSYKLTYVVDDETYQTKEVNYGAVISVEPAPNKVGYTFSGWSEIPATMPAHDVIISGTFKVNQYRVTFFIDDHVVSEQILDYGSTIVPPEITIPEGMKFSGWDQVVSTVPAHDVTFVGSFIANGYRVTYVIDGIEYYSVIVEFGKPIIPPAVEPKEGYSFSGWSEIPETMPAHEVTITGAYKINQYIITYVIDGEEYKKEVVDYGSTIVLPEVPEKEGFPFVWGSHPETMPACDITIEGSYLTGVADVRSNNSVEMIFTADGKRIKKLQRGVNIVIMNGKTRKVVVK